MAVTTGITLAGLGSALWAARRKGRNNSFRRNEEKEKKTSYYNKFL